MIRLLLLDVDGCLTEGKIIYTAEGDELKNFNVKDGFAIRTWLRMGHHVAIITGRESKIVKIRAEELKIQHLYQAVEDKLAVAQKLCEELGIKPEEVAAIGDDLNDIRLLKWVGQAYTPQDCVPLVKEYATVLDRKGGEAVVREMIEKVVDLNGERDHFLSFWI